MSDILTAELGGEARSVPCTVITPIIGPVPGMVQGSPPARMSGAQVVTLAGVVASRSNWDGIVCLTGSRTVWAHVSAGEVVSFASFLSVEMASNLGTVADDGFLEGMEAVLSRPERLAGELAQGDVTPARAWGALIGAELAATRPYWLGQEVLLVGDGPVVAAYAKALAHQGVMLQELSASEMFEAGQSVFASSGKGTA